MNSINPFPISNELGLIPWAPSQHHIAREFHVAVMLRQFFMALQQELTLLPGPHMCLTRPVRVGGGLIELHALDIAWKVALQRLNGLA